MGYNTLLPYQGDRGVSKMFNAYATENGWEVYHAGASTPVAIFEKLASVKKAAEDMGAKLTVHINGYAVC